MPATHRPSSQPQTIRTAAAPPWITAAVAMLSAWAQRRRQRRALAALGPGLLRDVGLTRADAMRESGKPFWRR
ncbi:DUF1127 domain-containing protein [Azospirillum sp. sgz301742]